MYSLNPVGASVTHVALSASYPTTPLCGFMADDETVTSDTTVVSCLDCLAAMTPDQASADLTSWMNELRDVGSVPDVPQ